MSIRLALTIDLRQTSWVVKHPSAGWAFEELLGRPDDRYAG